MSRFFFPTVATVLITAASGCRPDNPVEASESPSVVRASAQAARNYEMIDLGLLGASSIEPGRIDKKGRVYAYGTGSDYHQHIYRWEDGAVADLGAIPPSGSLAFSPNGLVGGTACSFYSGTCTFYLFDEGTITTLPIDGTAYEDESSVNSVLDDGTVIGHVQYADHQVLAFWRDGVRHDLPPLSAAYPRTYGGAMNKHDQLIAQSLDLNRLNSRPYFWENGVARDLGTLVDHPCADNPAVTCGSASASAINNHGDVVGGSQDANGNNRPVIWRNAGAVEDLGVFSGQSAFAFKINDHGDIYGFGGPESWWGLIDGTLYSPGAPVGAFSHPTGMNEDGEVAGYFRAADGKSHAFVWSRGQMTDLGTGPDGAQYTAAYFINDRGDVLGAYLQGQQRLVLWRPTSANNIAAAP